MHLQFILSSNLLISMLYFFILFIRFLTAFEFFQLLGFVFLLYINHISVFFSRIQIPCKIAKHMLSSSKSTYFGYNFRNSCGQFWFHGHYTLIFFLARQTFVRPEDVVAQKVCNQDRRRKWRKTHSQSCPDKLILFDSILQCLICFLCLV